MHGVGKMKRANVTPAEKPLPKQGRFIRAMRAVKRYAKEFGPRAVLASALIGTLALSGIPSKARAEKPQEQPGKAHAEEPKQPEKSLSARVLGGSYDKGQTPFGGFGASGHLGFGHVKVDTMFDVIFPKFNSSELDTAELDITFPINRYFAFTPFIYTSHYYGQVPVGTGIAFHIPALNLHVAPHWCSGSNVVPMPIFWTPSIGGGRLNFMVKIIPVLNHAALPKPAPFLGGEVKMSVKVHEGIRVYGKVWEMLARDGSGKVFVGGANAQAGLELTY